MRKLSVLILIFLLLIGSSCFSQTDNQDQIGQGRDILGKTLAFIDTIAQYLGKGIIKLIGTVADVDLPNTLEVPVGYLSVMTIALALFGLMEAARKVIWLVVLLGWGLIILRVVMEILGKSKA